jgi:PAS domain S-box-containing protein
MSPGGMAEPSALVNFPQADEGSFRLLLEMLTEGILIYSAGRALYFNPVGLKLAAVPDQPNYVGRPVSDFFRPEQFAEINQVLQIMESLGKASEPREQRFLRHDGMDLYIEVFSVPVRFGNQPARMAVFRDITPRKHAELALRESETYLRLLLSQFPGLVWSTDAELRITSCLGTAHHRHGFKSGQLVGRNLSEIYPAQGEQEHFEIRQHRRALAGESIEYRSRCGQSTFETRLEPLRNGEGVLEGLFAVSQDITSKASDEDALRSSEMQLRTLAHLSPVGLFRLDHRGLCNFVSDQWIALTGISAAKAEGRGWMLAIHPDDREQTMLAWNKSMQNGQQFQSEFRLLNGDGTSRWVIGQGLPEKGSNPSAHNYLGALTDITNRKEAELLLDVQKSHLALIAEAAPLKEILHSLRNFLERQVALGSVMFIVHDDDRKRWVAAESAPLLLPLTEAFLSPASQTPDHPLQKVLQSRQPLNLADLGHQGAWAALLHLHGFKSIHLQPIVGLKGEALGVLGLFRTMQSPIDEFAVRVFETTAYLGGVALDRRRREDAERHSRELRELNRRILEASRMKSEFLAKMSHELRTPLNAIIGLSELLLDRRPGPLTLRQAEYVGDVLQSGMHLLRLINDVLDLTKIEAGKNELKLEQVTVDEITAEVCEVLQPLAVGRGIDLAWTSSLQPGEEADLDARKFRQVLYNLLSNAIKFTPDHKGMVRVHLDLDKEGSLVVTVQDNGPGIRQQDLSKLFQPFTQFETTSGSNHQGTGLGLAISQQLVELHGGAITVESVFGEGASFKAVFPQPLKNTPIRP